MIRGYAVLYGVPSVPVDENLFCEVVEPGAFDRSVRLAAAGLHHVVCRIDHDPRRRLGSTRRGDLRLWADERGVGFQLDGHRLPRGFVGASFQFDPLLWRREGELLYRLLEGSLTEISLCTVPVCYPRTRDFIEEVTDAVVATEA